MLAVSRRARIRANHARARSPAILPPTPATRPAPATLTKRLVVVTGKGGVGKSAVAAALGLVAARSGLRTIVAEVGARTEVATLLGARAAASPAETPLGEPGLAHVSIQPGAAMQEYLRNEVPGRLPAAILARSRIFELLVEATPGMRELLTVGKVWELTQRPRHTAHAAPYDLVVLDAPATGHALALLGAPRTFTSVARVGPVARQGAAIEGLLHDPRRTAVLAVAAPEQMAVTETLGLRDRLAGDLGIALDGVVVNRMMRSRLHGAGAQALAAAPGDDPAVRSARWLEERARIQRAQLARLRRGLDGVRCTTLPFLFCTEFGRAEVDALAGDLRRALS